ncbi:hypothetical protein BKA66DRAFT_608867 [Pyrenochaeta sp. MPI-SDFR-AT-0127]|nr:hypothetical protein BKA66DRAFT_608867 [Pyrenochaeta sp. MPI-SDFR-AT-0127]
MPTTYTISVKNNSGMDHDYFLFVEAPVVSAGAKVHQTVYINSPRVDDRSGSATFTFCADHYGICGSSQNRLGHRVVVVTSDSEPVQINQGATAPGSHLLINGGLNPDGSGRPLEFLESAKKTDCGQAGAFQIDCTKLRSIDRYNLFIGLGAQDPEDSSNIVPIAVVEASPTSQTFFHPRATYYIAWGSFQPGQIIEPEMIARPARIDFTGKNSFSATVLHNVDGTWSVT